MFGWGRDGAVTSLIPVYTRFGPTPAAPYYAVMPRAEDPKAQWPPFTDERPFGRWFWEHYRAEEIISLDCLIAETPDTVFWANTKMLLGWDSCAIARNVKAPGGYTLRRGVYVYHQALQACRPVPPLRILLADGAKSDLAPRFRRAR